MLLVGFVKPHSRPSKKCLRICFSRPIIGDVLFYLVFISTPVRPYTGIFIIIVSIKPEDQTSECCHFLKGNGHSHIFSRHCKGILYSCFNFGCSYRVAGIVAFHRDGSKLLALLYISNGHCHGGAGPYIAVRAGTYRGRAAFHFCYSNIVGSGILI